jgi:hypothetical protein
LVHTDGVTASPEQPQAATASQDQAVTAPQEQPQVVTAPQEQAVTAHGPGVATWPAATNLIFLPGSNKVMLTIQLPVMRAVIQDAIERTRANLMFGNVFPNVFDTLEYLRDALVTAAELNDEAVDIHRRLLGEHLYFVNMSRLVSTKIFEINLNGY